MKRRFTFALVTLFFIILISSLTGCASTRGKLEKSPDSPWYDSAHQVKKDKIKLTRQSVYIPMRDGVLIAADIYLPEDRKESEVYPTILAQTRYWRMIDLRFWVRPFFKIPPEEIEKVVAAGYAFVRIDARGSGASFGFRPSPWSADEIKDGAEVVDWIIKQPWSNRVVGAAGCSYEGTSSEFLLVNNHPNVKAIAPTFALFDAYADIAFPGGNQLVCFTRQWQSGNAALDANRPQDAVWWAKLATSGVSPVDADKNRDLLQKAVAQHGSNYKVHDEASQLTFRDDTSRNGLNIDKSSPHKYIPQLQNSKAAIYSYSGWYDGGYPHAAIKRFLTLGNPGSKLILGPWDHGGDDFVRPFDKTIKSEFGHVEETIRFFDYHLKGVKNGIGTEPAVHYFTQVENKWKEADTWPPKAKNTTFYFAPNYKLSLKKPTQQIGYDLYKVDLTASTGPFSRWDCLAQDVSVRYTDRAAADKKLLHYQTPPLNQDMEVTGHPVVSLYVSSDQTDGQFFVYLEDVDPAGRVAYVTEGMLRAIHRKISDQNPPYKTPTPFHTYEKKDALPLVAGQPVLLSFDLLPISHLFKKGHSVRVAIAGADSDHFKMVNETPPFVTFFRTQRLPSSISLPIIE